MSPEPLGRLSRLSELPDRRAACAALWYCRVLFPRLIRQPSLGLRIAASRPPSPAKATLKGPEGVRLREPPITCGDFQPRIRR